MKTMNEKAKAALAEYRRKVKAGELPKPVRRKGVRMFKTTGTLDGSFGPERGRKLIVTIDHNDVITLRPERTRHKEAVHLVDVYRFAIRARVNRTVLEKARLKKEKKKEQRESRRVQYFDQKLRSELRAN